MSGAWRDAGHESQILLSQLDGHLASIRAERDPDDVALVERVVGVLRLLVAETAFASAADRARVRAAVHYFALRREGRGDRWPARTLSEDVRVVGEIVRGLGRPDLPVDPLTSRPGQDLLTLPAPVPEPA